MSVRVVHCGKCGAVSLEQNSDMKTLSERIDDYMQRKGLDRLAAIEALLTFALDTIDARRKGGSKVGNRPEQEKHLARARKIRAK